MTDLRVLLLVATVAMAVGCAKKRETDNRVAHNSGANTYFKKSEFQTPSSSGHCNPQTRLFSLTRGIEYVDPKKDLGAVPGSIMDFGLVNAVITETELQFIAAHRPSQVSGLERVIVSYPIKSHFDIDFDTNAFGNKTHIISEQKDREWCRREYIRVDWASPSNAFGRVPNQLWSFRSMTEESRTLIGNPTLENGQISFLVESSIGTTSALAELLGLNIADEGSIVQSRTHITPVSASDFEALEYSNRDFVEFGLFRTYERFEDPEKGLLDSTIKQHAMIHDVCESGRRLSNGQPASCATNKIVFHLNHAFPGKYLPLVRMAAVEWNETFKKALNRQDDVVVLDESYSVDISDPRHNVLVLYPHDTRAGLLGLGQMITDNRTGRTITARAIVYEGGIQGTRGWVDDIVREVIENPGIIDELGVPTNGVLANARSEDAATVLRASADLRKNLGLDNRVRIDETPVSTNLARTISRAHDLSSANSARAMQKRREAVERIPELLRLSDMDKAFDSLTSLVSGPYLAGSQQNLFEQEVRRNPNGGKAVLQGLDNLLFANKTREIERLRRLERAALGIHGSEFVEDAAISYITKILKDNPGIVKREDQIALVKDKVEMLTFYTTMLHEMGHAFGLRHNFIGSADLQNFHPKFFELVQDPDATFEDIQPYAYSSVMDYHGKFYSGGDLEQGALGPYDQAAIRFAYNRGLPVQEKANMARQFMFCTDHNVGEQLLCDRFDHGVTVNEKVADLIGSYRRSYVRSHFRRNRANFDRFAGSIPGRLLFRYMLPVRQSLDEFIYQVIQSPPGQVNGDPCPAFFANSINRGEMVNICNPIQAEAFGVEFSDWSTLVRALIDPRSGRFLSPPAVYIPNGAADLILAGFYASNFFSEILGAPEVGNYLAEVKTEEGMKPCPLEPVAEGSERLQAKGGVTCELTNLGGDPSVPPAQVLIGLAAEREIPPEQLQDFVESNIGNLAQLDRGLVAKFFESRSSSDGFTRLESLGFVHDKLMAMLAMGIRDLGVTKYRSVSLAGNAYTWPQSKKIAGALMESFITNNTKIHSIDIPLQQGRINLPVDATLNLDLREIAVIIGLVDFTSDRNLDFVDKIRVCSTRSQSCEIDPVKSVSIRTASGNGELLTATQVRSQDSISHKLISDAVEAANLLEKWESTIENSSEIKGNITEIQQGLGVRAERIEAVLKLSPLLEGVSTQVTAQSAPPVDAIELLSTLAERSVLSIANAVVGNPALVGDITARALGGYLQGRMETSITLVEESIEEMIQTLKQGEQNWQARLETVENLRAARKALSQLKPLKQELKEMYDMNVDIRVAVEEADSAETELRGQENLLRYMNKITTILGY